MESKNYYIRDLVQLITDLGHKHPEVNYVGVGQIAPNEEINSYPYLWVGVENTHTLVEGFSKIAYTFTLRVGDLVNDNEAIVKNKVNNPVIRGIGIDNGLDVHSDTFRILLDIVIMLKSNLTTDLKSIMVNEEVEFTPFFEAELGGTNGFEALVTIEVPLYRQCNTPLTDL